MDDERNGRHTSLFLSLSLSPSSSLYIYKGILKKGKEKLSFPGGGKGRRILFINIIDNIIINFC